MKGSYYIYNPYSKVRRLVSSGELKKLTKLTMHELYHVVSNCTYLKNLGYILPSNTPEVKFKIMDITKYWAKLTIPCECDYEISHHGEVRRIKANGTKSKPLTPQYNKAENRYYVKLSVNGKRVDLYLDAAVVHHFFDGAEDPYNEIEYIDKNPANVHYSNLRVIQNKMGADERWVPIKKGENRYEISNYGRVRNVVNNRYTYLQGVPKGGSGSMCVYLSLPGNRGFQTISRLVAQHFLEDFSEELYVTCKDGDNTNLYYKNLMMVTKEYIGRRSLEKSRNVRRIVGMDTVTNVKLGPYMSSKEAGKAFGVSHRTIRDNINNRTKKVAKRYIFRYEDQVTSA